MTITERVKQLVRQHGGLVKAARAIDISPGYLSRLGYGSHFNPGASVLRKLGLRKVIRFERINGEDSPGR